MKESKRFILDNKIILFTLIILSGVVLGSMGISLATGGSLSKLLINIIVFVFLIGLIGLIKFYPVISYQEIGKKKIILPWLVLLTAIVLLIPVIFLLTSSWWGIAHGIIFTGFVITLVIFFVITLTNLKWGVFLFIAILPSLSLTRPFLDFDLWIFHITAETLFLAILGIAWIFNSKPAKMKNAFFFLVLLWLFFSLLSVFFSYNPLISLRAFFMGVLEPIIFFGILIQTVESFDDIKKLILSLCSGITLISLYGMYKLLSLGISPPSLIHNRSVIGAAVINENILAEMMIMSIVLSAVVLVMEKSSITERYISIITFLVMVITIFFSLSRGAWLSAVVCFFILGLFVKRWRPYLSILLIVFIALLVIFPSVLLFTTTKISFEFITKDPSVLERTYAWETSLNMIEKKPVFGIGMGMYRDLYFYYKVENKASIFAHAHNLILQIGSEMGLICLAIFIFIYLYALLKSFYLAIKGKTDYYKRIAAAIFASLSGYLIFAETTGSELVHVTWGNIMANTFVFWTILGILIVLDKSNKLGNEQEVKINKGK